MKAADIKVGQTVAVRRVGAGWNANGNAYWVSAASAKVVTVNPTGGTTVVTLTPEEVERLRAIGPYAHPSREFARMRSEENGWGRLGNGFGQQRMGWTTPVSESTKFLVSNRDIRMTWEDWVAFKEQAEEDYRIENAARIADARSRDEARETAKADIERMFDAVGMGMSGYVSTSGDYTVDASVMVEFATKFARMVGSQA